MVEAPSGVQQPRRGIIGLGLALSVMLAFLAGLLFSMHVFVVGRLATHVESAEVAASVNSVVASIALLATAVSTRAWRRALRRLRDGARARPWHVLMGVNSGLFVIAGSTVAPKVGVALFTVAAVCGQTLGGLVVDRLALSPAGRRPFTSPRVVGAALALIAVGISALGSHGDLHLGWLGLVVLVGAASALQQAAMGHLARTTGEPLAAAWINTTGGLVVVLAAWLLLQGGATPNGWSAPPEQWLVPGLCNAAAVVLVATVVGRLGVLRLMLAVIAGQSVAALLLDAIAPTAGEVVTLRTVIGVVLTLAAVAVSGLGRARPRPIRRPPPGATDRAEAGSNVPATRRA